MTSTHAQLIRYARTIAVLTMHENLVNGLQDWHTLRSKYSGEWEEFEEKVAHNASKLELLHEAADIRYYAACLDEQEDDPNIPPDGGYWAHALEELSEYGLSESDIDKAALAKYAWRSEKPGNKDEAYELQLIEQAIAQ